MDTSSEGMVSHILWKTAKDIDPETVMIAVPMVAGNGDRGALFLTVSREMLSDPEGGRILLEMFDEATKVEIERYNNDA